MSSMLKDIPESIYAGELSKNKFYNQLQLIKIKIKTAPQRYCFVLLSFCGTHTGGFGSRRIDSVHVLD